MFTEKMAIALLQEKCASLGRTPKKEDFDPADVSRIKSKLGPWPRALETAGLKESIRSRGKNVKTKKIKNKGAIHDETKTD